LKKEFVDKCIVSLIGMFERCCWWSGKV